MSYSKYDLNSKITSIQASTGIVSSKISSLQVPPTPNVLSVVDTVTVDSGIIGYTQISGGSMELTSPLSTTSNLITQDNITIVGVTGENSLLSKDSLIISGNTLPDIRTTLNKSSLILTDGTTTNTLDTYTWSGNIQTVNTVANLTHYLNFSDSSATGFGKPQKNATLSCNPSTGLLTATTFSGSLTGNASSSSSISLTSDNTAGTYYLPFSKTVASNSTLYVDNITGPLTYNPSTSTLTATTFVGALTGTSTSSTSITTVSDNTVGTYYIPFSKTIAGLSTNLYLDDTTTALTYNPSTSTLTATTFVGALTGTSTSSTSITTVSDNTVGTYYIPFSKTIAGLSTNLYLDDTTTALTYNPSTSTLTASTFVGALTGTSTSSTSITTVSDNTSGTYYIPFSKTTAGTSTNLYLDDTSGPLTYNPSLGSITSSVFVGDLQYSSTANSITSFTTNTLTISAGSYSLRSFNWVLTGTTNTMSGLTISGSRNNGIYSVGILNNGSGNFNISSTLTGTNIKTKFSSGVSVSPGGFAVMNIQILTINAVVYTIVDAYNIF